jgi:hypothetical protein
MFDVMSVITPFMADAASSPGATNDVYSRV